MDEKRTHEPGERRLGLSITQVVGAALAAGSSAFIASTLGVAGTIVGAVVGSVVATVGTATYTRSIRRSSTVVRQYSAQLWDRTTLDAPVPDPNAPDVEEPAEETTVPVAEETIEERAPAGRLAWGKIAGVSAAVLAVTLGGITVLEAVIGEPLSAVTGGSDKSGTTLGNVGGDSRPSRPRRTPTPAPTVTVTPTPTPSAEPTQTPTGTPTTDPTETPTTPAPTPSETPETVVPEPTPTS